MDKTQQAVDLFDKLAELYQSKYMDVSLYADTLDLFCGCIPVNGRVIELACGPGNVTKYVLDKRPDLVVLGTDLAPNMIDLARKNNPRAEFQLMDCRDLVGLGKTFDAVLCGFALPYLSKEEAIQFIHNSSTVLNSGGVCYISTMEGNYADSQMQTGSTGDQLFMHYHEAGYLTDAFVQSGFSIKELVRKNNTAANATDLVIIACKH